MGGYPGSTHVQKILRKCPYFNQSDEIGYTHTCQHVSPRAQKVLRSRCWTCPLVFARAQKVLKKCRETTDTEISQACSHVSECDQKLPRKYPDIMSVRWEKGYTQTCLYVSVHAKKVPRNSMRWDTEYSDFYALVCPWGRMCPVSSNSDKIWRPYKCLLVPRKCLLRRSTRTCFHLSSRTWKEFRMWDGRIHRVVYTSLHVPRQFPESARTSVSQMK